MHHDWTIEHGEEQYVYTHIRVAQLGFGIGELPQCYWVAQVAIRSDHASVLASTVCVAPVEVHIVHCACSVSGESLQYHVAKKGSRPMDYPEAYVGVILLQPLHVYCQECSISVASPLRLCAEVFWSDIAFPQLWHAKPLICPFRPYWTQGTCQTVLAVPDLLALPQL